MDHAGFIIAAYAVAAILLGGLVVLTLLEYRAQKRRLAERENDPGARP